MMGIGIMVCGLNGCGKSTLGKAFAEKLNFYFTDNEYLFFPDRKEGEAYKDPKSHEEAVEILENALKIHENFVFAAVIGNYGSEAMARYDYVVYIKVPKEVRSQRVRQRAYKEFGERTLPGGDLYEQQERFFKFAEERDETYVENWLKGIGAKIIEADGTRPIDENVEYIIEKMRN